MVEKIIPPARLLIAACVSVLLIGCSGESKPPPLPASEATAPPSPRAPHGGTGQAPATVIADNVDANATLQQLTQALRDHVVRTRSVPKDFEEFTAKSGVTFPPPPAGKKYAIQGQEVVLVNR